MNKVHTPLQCYNMVINKNYGTAGEINEYTPSYHTG